MTLPPCKRNGIECPHRYPDCRSRCEKYHNWLAIHTEEKARFEEKKQRENDVNEFRFGNQDRFHKYSNVKSQERQRRRKRK